MIKIFKKKRQQLLKENKISSYIIYAIGEIILVVIGILIAVFLNDQNELQKQKLVEIDILEGIRKDILKDSIDLSTNIRGYNWNVKSDSLLLDHLVNKRENDKRLVSYLYEAITVDWSIILHDSHFQEAQQKGLSIISNESLRVEISTLYEFTYKALKYIENENLTTSHSKLLTDGLGQYIGYNTEGIFLNEDKYQKLLLNSNSIYLIYQGVATKGFLLARHKATLKSAMNLANKIEQEISNLKK